MALIAPRRDELAKLFPNLEEREVQRLIVYLEDISTEVNDIELEDEGPPLAPNPNLGVTQQQFDEIAQLTQAALTRRDVGGVSRDELRTLAALLDLIVASQQSLIAEIRRRLVFRGVYDQEAVYQKNDVATDESWLMRANKKTTDRPAPQRIGLPRSEFNQVDPGFATVVSPSDTQWLTGQRFTQGFDQEGYVTQVFYFSPVASPDITYEIYIVLDPTGDQNFTLVGTATPNATGWFALGIGSVFIPPGRDFDLVLITDDTSVTQTVFVGDWDYKRKNGNPDSSDGEIWHQNNNVNMRISNEDDSGTNRRTELLTLDVGDTIAASNIVWKITEVVSQPSWGVSLNVTPASRLSENTYTFTFTTFAATTVSYAELANYYAGRTVRGFNGPDYPTAVGTLNDEAYGVDALFQPVIFSDDWDFMAYSR